MNRELIEKHNRQNNHS